MQNDHFVALLSQQPAAQGLPELKVTSSAPCLAALDGLFSISFSNLFLNQYLFLASAVSCDECHRIIMYCVKYVHLFLCFKISA